MSDTSLPQRHGTKFHCLLEQVQKQPRQPISLLSCSIGKAGASKVRRLILLVSVGRS